MIKLTDTEQIGLKILALLRSQQLTAFKCTYCVQELQEARNCVGDENHNSPVYYNELVGEFYACPLTFISQSVYSFIERYDYYEKYPSAVPAFEDINPRYWEAVKFYENFLYELRQQDTGKEEKSNDNLANMKKQFFKK